VLFGSVHTPIPLLQLLLVKVGRLLQLLQLVVWELLGLSAGRSGSVSRWFPVSLSGAACALQRRPDKAGVEGLQQPLAQAPTAMPLLPPEISGTGDARFRSCTYKLPMFEGRLSYRCRCGQQVLRVAAPRGTRGDATRVGCRKLLDRGFAERCRLIARCRLFDDVCARVARDVEDQVRSSRFVGLGERLCGVKVLCVGVGNRFTGSDRCNRNWTTG